MRRESNFGQKIFETFLFNAAITFGSCVGRCLFESLKGKIEEKREKEEEDRPIGF